MAAAAADAAMAAGLAEREPAWLRSLLGARFFEACAAHRGMSRNECNQYCLTCAAAADDAGGAAAVGCQWCVVAAHGGGGGGAGAGRDRCHRHRVVQVRRSSYHNVVRVSELERALDLTRVQTYVINRDRVVFLNERPQAPRNGRCAAAAAVACAACEACGRGLLDVAFRFCSLGCKVRAPAAGHAPFLFRASPPPFPDNLKCMESDPTLTFTIDPNNIPEPQISGPQEDEEDDDDEEDEPGGRRVARGDREEDQEAAANILAFAAAAARSVPAASAADPNSYRRRARKGAHRAPERSPFF
uniref:PLATZ transcription factor family protein n=1 Tax=Oryza meridionalis TaxID=40149 RepID=A0A0E0CH59_9ORYZ